MFHSLGSTSLYLLCGILVGLLASLCEPACALAICWSFCNGNGGGGEEEADDEETNASFIIILYLEHRVWAAIVFYFIKGKEKSLQRWNMGLSLHWSSQFWGGWLRRLLYFLQTLIASLLSEKWTQHYSTIISWLRCIISFSLIRSSIHCL